MAKPGKILAVGVLGAGVVYWIYKQNPGAFQGFGLSPAALAAQNRATAQNQSAAGNAPVVQPAGFFGSPSGVAAIDSAILGATGILYSAGVFGTGLVAGAATLGIGFAVAFASYELLRQRASMHTNDVRDAWTFQFIALHDALGLTKLTPAQTAGSGPGSVEMGEVIYYFDRDSSQRLWNAVTHTQDESQFRTAAHAIDVFLKSNGVPVQDPA